MTPEQFCYWLQGRAELQPANPPSAEEWKVIADHLRLVFRKETPARSQADNLFDAIERAKRNAQQQSIVGTIVGGIPQCGSAQLVQYGRNQPHIC